MYLGKIETTNVANNILTDEEIKDLEQQEDEMNYSTSSWDCETYYTSEVNQVIYVKDEEEELPF